MSLTENISKMAAQWTECTRRMLHKILKKNNLRLFSVTQIMFVANMFPYFFKKMASKKYLSVAKDLITSVF